MKSSNVFTCRPFRMPGLLFVVLFLMIACAVQLHAQLVTGRFVSSVYTWEQFDTVGVSKKFTRGMLSAIFDVGQGNFILRTHFQAAGIDGGAEYRLPYLYGQLRNIGNVADVSFGRLPYFVGVGTGTLDGALTTLRFADNRYKVTVYGGANVPIDLTLKGWRSVKNRFAVGGQFLTTAIPNFRGSLSYINRRREREPYFSVRPDALFEPVTVLITPDVDKEEFASVDASYQFSRASLYGRYDYDLNARQTHRVQAGARFDLTEKLSLTGDVIHRVPRVPYNSFFAVFSLSNVDEYEAGADYLVTPQLRTFVRGAYVQYTDDKSFRYTAGVALDYVGLTFRGNTGYAGELNSLTFQGSFPLLNRMLIPNAALSFASYRLNSSAKRENTFSAVLGATVRPLSAVSVDLQGQWLRNYIVQSDFRLFGKLNVWFSEHLNIFD